MSKPTTSNPTTQSFAREDLDNLDAAFGLIREWRIFLLARFADYTHHTDVYPVGGGTALDPVEDIFARTNAGYGHFTLPEGWYTTMCESLDTPDAAVTVQHIQSAGGPGNPLVRTYLLPLAFALGEASEANPEYAAYLRLRAKFEPTAPESLSEEARRAAATELARHARVALPASDMLDNPVLSDEVYAAALTDAARQTGGGQGDLFSRIHTLAKTLGLPARPSYPLSKKRVEAARVLFVQSRTDHSSDLPAREQYEALALPENRDKALLAYHTAITSLHQPHHGGLGDVRRQVYEAARILNLDTSSTAVAEARLRTENTKRP